MKNDKNNLQYIASIVIDYLRVLALLEYDDSDTIRIVNKWLDNAYDVFCKDK